MENKETNRPVIFFDLETTGKDKDTNEIRIIQISAYKYDNINDLNVIGKLKRYCNPGDKHIQPGAIEVHGITEDMVKNCPTFHEIAHEVFEFFDGCDLGGYNNSFYDNTVLNFSFMRADIKWNYRDLKVYDVLTLYRKHFPNTLSAVYKRLTGKELDGAHDADSDIIGTVDVYKCLREQGIDFEESELKVYEDRLDMIGFFKVRYDENNKAIPYYDGKGAHVGKTVEEVGLSYLNWVANSPDKFPIDTRHVANQLYKWLEKKFEVQRAAETDEWYNKIANS